MDCSEDRLEIDSQLTELSRVRLWTESVSCRLVLSEQKRFAMHLCLEEAVANVILHGYRSEPGHPILITTVVGNGILSFRIDDHAPSFSPIDALPVSSNGESPGTLDSITPGGNGLRLLKKFSGSLHYQRLPDGNRLTIAFPLSGDVLSA